MIKTQVEKWVKDGSSAFKAEAEKNSLQNQTQSF